MGVVKKFEILKVVEMRIEERKEEEDEGVMMDQIFFLPYEKMKGRR